MTVETEPKISLDQFSEVDRLLLVENGFLVVRLQGRSLYDFENQKKRFVALLEFLKNKDKVFSEKSSEAETAVVPHGIFLPDSYRATYEDQERLLLDYEEKIKKLGIKNIKVIFPSVADCMEIAVIEAERGINVFGYKGYLYSRTSTSNSPDSTVIIGCDDLSTSEDIFGETSIGDIRGIHVQDYPKDNDLNSVLNVIPKIIPYVK